MNTSGGRNSDVPFANIGGTGSSSNTRGSGHFLSTCNDVLIDFASIMARRFNKRGKIYLLSILACRISLGYVLDDSFINAMSKNHQHDRFATFPKLCSLVLQHRINGVIESFDELMK